MVSMLKERVLICCVGEEDICLETTKWDIFLHYLLWIHYDKGAYIMYHLRGIGRLLGGTLWHEITRGHPFVCTC